MQKKKGMKNIKQLPVFRTARNAGVFKRKSSEEALVRRSTLSKCFRELSPDIQDGQIYIICCDTTKPKVTSMFDTTLMNTSITLWEVGKEFKEQISDNMFWNGVSIGAIITFFGTLLLIGGITWLWK